MRTASEWAKTAGMDGDSRIEALVEAVRAEAVAHFAAEALAGHTVRDLTRASDALGKQQKSTVSFPAIPIDHEADALVDGMLAKARGINTVDFRGVQKSWLECHCKPENKRRGFPCANCAMMATKESQAPAECKHDTFYFEDGNATYQKCRICGDIW